MAEAAYNQGSLMPIEFAYQVVKDLIALAKMKEADPVDRARQIHRSWQ